MPCSTSRAIPTSETYSLQDSDDSPLSEFHSNKLVACSSYAKWLAVSQMLKFIRNFIVRYQHTQLTRRLYKMTQDNPKQSSTLELSNELAPEIPPKDSRRELLMLPSVSTDSDATKMDMSGGSASVMLDQLGPVVVGLDGSLSRIANYQKMTEAEKQNTLRVISKRNKERLEALKIQKEGENEKSKRGNDI